LVPKAAVSRYSEEQSHSITSSARASSAGGASRPSAFAIPRLMTRSLPIPLRGCQLGLRRLYVPLQSGSAGFAQWLYAGIWDAGLAVELLETRHVRDAFQGDAGQDRSEGRAWHCPADAAGLVPPPRSSASLPTRARADMSCVARTRRESPASPFRLSELLSPRETGHRRTLIGSARGDGPRRNPYPLADSGKRPDDAGCHPSTSSILPRPQARAEPSARIPDRRQPRLIARVFPPLSTVNQS
jgi:hypothetical protein